MPILIRELHIKVTVDETAGKAASSPAGQATGRPGEPEQGGNERIVEECVEQVLTILRNRWSEK